MAAWYPSEGTDSMPVTLKSTMGCVDRIGPGEGGQSDLTAAPDGAGGTRIGCGAEILKKGGPLAPSRLTQE